VTIISLDSSQQEGERLIKYDIKERGRERERRERERRRRRWIKR
jgi:hypothetical protein